MWYIWRSGSGTPGRWVAQTRTEVGPWAEIVAGPFKTWQEANEALDRDYHGRFSYPWEPRLAARLTALKLEARLATLQALAR